MEALNIRVLALVVLVVGVVPARTEAADCKAAATTHEVMQCMQDELATSDVELSALMAKIGDRLTANQLILLKAAQLAWESFRFSNCSSARSLNDEGTLAPITFLGCMVDVTEWRIANLKDGYASVLNSSE